VGHFVLTIQDVQSGYPQFVWAAFLSGNPDLELAPITIAVCIQVPATAIVTKIPTITGAVLVCQELCPPWRLERLSYLLPFLTSITSWPLLWIGQWAFLWFGNVLGSELPSSSESLLGGEGTPVCMQMARAA
jgi:hypothetical protein